MIKLGASTAMFGFLLLSVIVGCNPTDETEELPPAPAPLLAERPEDAEAIIKNDLPNENGIPNHAPEGEELNNHDTLTGTNKQGELDTTTGSTCNDWTSAEAGAGEPRIGHSWPGAGNSGANWMSEHQAPGCMPGTPTANPGDGTGTAECVGCAGGYGGIYCFALTP